MQRFDTWYWVWIVLTEHSYQYYYQYGLSPLTDVTWLGSAKQTHTRAFRSQAWSAINAWAFVVVAGHEVCPRKRTAALCVVSDWWPKMRFLTLLPY